MKRNAATKSKRSLYRLGAVAALWACVLLMTACGGEEGDPYADREVVDLAAYESMADYGGTSMLVDTDVQEAAALIEDRRSFVLYAGFADCPYCNLLIPYLNEVAAEKGVYVGYIDTRKNPAWQSNMDIDDYDLFVDLFGDYLDEDDEGRPHLYTPDIYFIKDGEVVSRHVGVVEGADDPSVPLSEEQESVLRQTLREEFDAL